MSVDFEAFHPNDVNSKIKLTLSESGIEYTNIRTGAFQYMSYAHVIGFSGWIPNYGSLHIFSANTNLTMHVNFDQEVATESLNKIQAILTSKMKQYNSSFELAESAIN